MKSLLCLGDSITEGYEVPSDKRWTDLLSQTLDIPIINAGISGDTTAGMLARCERLLMEHQPSHMLVIGGTNDLWFGLKDELIISNLYAMAKQTKYHNAQCIIGIPTPCFNLNELNFNRENYSECIRSFRTLLKRHCEFKEMDYIDFATNMTFEHMLDDGVHPNTDGHRLMMQNFVNWTNSQN